MKVLIVDDNSDDRRFLRANLEHHGCEVMEAADGQEGLEMASKERPAVIISDALMPHMDGFQFLRSVKTDETLKTIPFIFYSSVYTGFKEAELATSLGAEAFIIKPKDPDDFWEELVGILEECKLNRVKTLTAELIEEEEEFLRKYSHIVAAKLEEKVKELDAEIIHHKKAKELLSLKSRIVEIFAILPDDEMFMRILRIVLETLKSEYGVFGYLDEKGDLVVPTMTRHIWDKCAVPEKDIVFPRSTWGDSTWPKALRGKKVVYSNERSVNTPSGHVEITRHISMPIVFQGESIGLLQVANKASDYDADDLALMQVIADNISPVLNARLQRNKAESSLRKSEEFNRSILESVGEGFIVIDRDYRIISANRAYCEQQHTTPQNSAGKHCYQCSHHTDKPCYELGEECAPKQTFDTGHPHTALHIHQGEHGDAQYIETRSYPLKDDSGVVTAVIEILLDVSDKRKLEEQLRQSQKMEALGQLAGGVAHDFNNILTAILGYSSLLQMKLPFDDPLRHNVEEILRSTTRASDLTQSLLAFSRKQVLNPKPIDLNETVKQVERFLHRLIGEDIKVDMRLDAEAVWALADHGQIEQVLMNLATNARDAMPNGGLLSIETGRAGFTEEYVADHGYGKPGNYALIAISDTGAGMDENTKKKIFEPFFTTKEVGKGTGLGLSIVYGIIKQHKGFINVYSESGKGTTFRIYLPLIAASAQVAQPEENAAPARGTETVLLAEDDEAARKLSKLVLEQFGYQVIAARDGVEAVEQFLANKHRIKLIILDVIMPKKNGREVYDEIRKLVPKIKVLFTSGYTADIIHKQGVLDEGLNFISKPASPTIFLKKVRDVLDT